ncbi:pre-mRNA-splicing factor SYF1 [Cryptococcus deuterogattii 99/473]|uniref:Pre-mRNA-splicing factor SYF1 n=2 Tax=Cryptococcus deuterogattii TaxID=1859096 RepID=A0A0D0UZA5_9TREE|nr:pre-mRNA-splicing factor SYF1 [Cryptococcus deuterogattii R265]KIR29512.1 pre-mRNA-splicing factor SYF1 [Cryptococcus deuterogattii LA55]KIR39539.1 pre-mRNA-splicing factor SYF1 [Cryptococcus deuterogattii Ram5]KIR73874.1 pre-mRNA-splicing factor SYF1 [Cryptococcus deuterogattii CA1014]KIR93366.1 pre-mRNA-splicing factor SYF1 [Cryptococcus deuterogattii CBS 10090]KIR99371.1 pre-mRNA-splicing factor SYF1 [Cryptococcus deuterogattii 2001/935-1]KIY59169.1 pre-mRNA-splicing factor SYF1 [Crypto
MASTSLVDTLTSYFPLTLPIPTPITHPHLIPPADLPVEEDLLHNPENLRSWLSYIHNVKEKIAADEPAKSGVLSPEEEILGPLASKNARDGLQRLVSIYERAIAVFPTSYKLWKAYYLTRQSYVLGELTNDAKEARSQQAKRGAAYKTNVRELLDGAEEAHEWTGGLDPVVGYAEWRSLIATGERMIMCLPNLPIPWLLHLGVLLHPKCPSIFKNGSYARKTFDRALRTLPPSLHGRIWGFYLRWAEVIGGDAGERVWRRYLKVDPSLTERHITYLLEADEPRPLAAAKYLLSIARRAQQNLYSSLEGKSPYQLFVDFLELVEKYADQIGMDEEETLELQKTKRAVKEKIDGEQPPVEEQEQQSQEEPASINGRLMRIAGPPVPLEQGKLFKPTNAASAQAPTELTYDEDTDPSNPRLLDVEGIVERDGLQVYKDQAGRLWTGLATYWIKKGEFERASATFEKGLAAVVTIRDFTQIFDAYAEFSETMISTLMDALADEDNLEDEDFDAEETEQELDERMKSFEELMDRRPFLVNDVLLRRNPNEVVEWEKRIALHGDDDTKVVETYVKALDIINPRKATGPLYPLYVNFAKFYEEGGSKDDNGEPKNEPDLKQARKIFERAVKVPFKAVDELAEVWCEWAEMELRNENYEEAIRLMQRATTVPKNTKINYYDDNIPPQSRLFKSLKLWSYYSDLEESIGTVESTKAVYDKIMELKIANAQVIVNYATFLEENKYFEESFKVYERGIELFHFPIAFEIWNIYLSKFVKRYGGKKLERARDLFEQALENCPEKFCKPLYLMYAKLEEEHGLAKRAMGIYDRAASTVQDSDKFEMYTIYIAKATANFGLPATRPIYERALESLPDKQTAEMCRRFARMERKLGEIDRARAIYAHASQFCDPRIEPEFWQEWNDFEIDTGSEDTFREMLRIKRAVQASFNTETSFIAAQAAAASKGTEKPTDASAQEAQEAADPMAAMERELNTIGADGARKGGAPAFVASTLNKTNANGIDEGEKEASEIANPDAIVMDEDEF